MRIISFFSTIKNVISQNDKEPPSSPPYPELLAHTLIFKSKNYYYFKDFNSNNKLSMIGKIRIDLFNSFVAELVKTSGSNNYPQ